MFGHRFLFLHLLAVFAITVTGIPRPQQNLYYDDQGPPAEPIYNGDSKIPNTAAEETGNGNDYVIAAQNPGSQETAQCDGSDESAAADSNQNDDQYPVAGINNYDRKRRGVENGPDQDDDHVTTTTSSSSSSYGDQQYSNIPSKRTVTPKINYRKRRDVEEENEHEDDDQSRNRSDDDNDDDQHVTRTTTGSSSSTNGDDDQYETIDDGAVISTDKIDVYQNNTGGDLLIAAIPDNFSPNETNHQPDNGTRSNNDLPSTGDSDEDALLTESDSAMFNEFNTSTDNVTHLAPAPSKIDSSKSNENSSAEIDGVVTPADVSNALVRANEVASNQISVLKTKIESWQKAVDNYLATGRERRRKRQQDLWSQFFPSPRQPGGDASAGNSNSNSPAGNEVVKDALKPAMQLMSQGVDLISNLYTTHMTRSGLIRVSSADIERHTSSSSSATSNSNNNSADEPQAAVQQFRDQLITLQRRLGDLGDQLQRVVSSFQRMQFPFLESMQLGNLFQDVTGHQQQRQQLVHQRGSAGDNAIDAAAAPEEAEGGKKVQ